MIVPPGPSLHVWRQNYCSLVNAPNGFANDDTEQVRPTEHLYDEQIDELYRTTEGHVPTSAKKRHKIRTLICVRSKQIAN